MEANISSRSKSKSHKNIKLKNNNKSLHCAIHPDQVNKKRNKYSVQIQKALNIIFSMGVAVIMSPFIFLMRLDDYLEEMCQGNQV